MTLSDTIDEALAWRLRLTAEALGAATTLDMLSTGLTVVAAGGVALAFWLPAPVFVVAFLGLQIVLGLVAKWAAVRVRFDAQVFDALADAVKNSGFRIEHLDRALRGVGMLPANKEGRDWDTRCKGALGLVRMLGRLTAAQGLLFVLAAGTIARI